MEHFKKLFEINVNGKLDKKKDNTGKELSYLSWAWAWAETKKAYPEATYSIKKFNNFPYLHDEETGYMVFTEVTIENMTYEMWLPVMNGSNKAMKNKPYKYTTKYGEKVVESATMFEINKAIMRCLVKNLAMFGLGLYIYSGEDLPEEEQEENKKTQSTPKKSSTPVKQSLPITTATTEGKEQDYSQEDKEKQKRSELGKLIIARVGMKEAKNELEKITSFVNSEGKTIKGVKELTDLKGKRLIVTLENYKKEQKISSEDQNLFV